MRTESGAGGGSSMSSSWRTSGPPVLWMRTAFTGLTQMLAEESVGAPIGEIGVRLVVMLAAFARECVVHFRICVDRHLRISFERIDDLLLRFGRGELVLAGDVQHQRLLDFFGFVQRGLDVHAIISDGRIGIGAR